MDVFNLRGIRITFCTLLKRWQAQVQIRNGFGGNFPWQAQYLVNLDDVLKSSKIFFCETFVALDLVHDDDFTWQAQCFGCFGSIFCGKRHTLETT